MSAVEVDFSQGSLFEVKMRKPESGEIALAHTRAIPLPALQTQELLKRDGLGEGDVISFTGGTGYISGYRVKDGRVTWTVDVADLEVEL